MDIVKLCLDMGASKAEEIPIEKFVFTPELRSLCEQNVCGHFGGNYTCPPHVGEVDDLIARLKSFARAVVWQNIYPLEDSFDFEGMMDAKEKHNAMTLEIARRVYGEMGRENTLVLAAGNCSICENCAVKTDESCRHPDEALAPIEAYGVNVSIIGEISDMKYINGKDTVTYFSGAFY